MAPCIAGRRVAVMGSIGQLFYVAQSGIDKWLSHVFSPNSLIMMGGGMKGRKLPDD